MLLLLWMVGSTWWHVCKIKLLCADSHPPPALTFPAPGRVPPLHIADSRLFDYRATGNFSFARSGAVANRGGTGALPDSLADYLKAHPGRTLVVSGYYSPLEQNESSFANLGLARAEDIKKLLLQQGVADNLLITSGIKKEDLLFSANGDSIYGGLAFTFRAAPLPTTATPVPPAALPVLDRPVTTEELARSQRFTSVFEPIDLYFPTGEATYLKTSETVRFFTEAKQYLPKNKGKKLVLTGHTNDQGPDAINLRLSRDRANAVKSRLRKLGIATDQIRVEARGETAPKASNSTPWGRRANRRVTVVVI